MIAQKLEPLTGSFLYLGTELDAISISRKEPYDPPISGRRRIYYKADSPIGKLFLKPLDKSEIERASKIVERLHSSIKKYRDPLTTTQLMIPIGLGVEGNESYLIYKYIPGVHIVDREESKKHIARFGYKYRRAAIASVCDAYKFLKFSRLIYTDLGPGNIMLVPNRGYFIAILDIDDASFEGETLYTMRRNYRYPVYLNGRLRLYDDVVPRAGLLLSLNYTPPRKNMSVVKFFGRDLRAFLRARSETFYKIIEEYLGEAKENMRMVSEDAETIRKIASRYSTRIDEKLRKIFINDLGYKNEKVVSHISILAFKAATEFYLKPPDRFDLRSMIDKICSYARKNSDERLLNWSLIEKP